jgi:pyridoxal phosphate enzyme (YggS family)
MTLIEIRTILAERLQALEQRIQSACVRAGRARNDVTLVAVTKYVGPEVAALLPELGALDLGESRPQELWRKAAALPKEVRWHLVGHLQTNKIEKTFPLVDAIHSADSVRLLAALEREVKRAGDLGFPTVLLEVNMSGEEAKHGFSPGELPALLPQLKSIGFLSVNGLMTMAALTDDPESARPAFRGLRQLRDRLQESWGEPNALTHLSMGMTHDFEIAIEEGATLIRVGSALFVGLPESPS